MLDETMPFVMDTHASIGLVRGAAIQILYRDNYQESVTKNASILVHRLIHGTMRKRHRTLTASTKFKKATSSFFHSKMIAKYNVVYIQEVPSSQLEETHRTITAT